MAALFAISLVFSAAAAAQEIKITGGVVPFQVFQREADNRGVIRLSGTSVKVPNNSFIEARVYPANSTTTVANGALSEAVRNGKWGGEIRVPVGGPYKIEVLVSTQPTIKAAVENVLVGDIWVLGGQSNMEGIGDMVNVMSPNEHIHSFNLLDTWEVARDPLHRLRTAIDPVHWLKDAQGNRQRWTFEREEQHYAQTQKGAGLGLPFATEMFRRTTVPVGLLPCAHGGTSMDEWSPAQKDKAGESLYGSMFRRIAAVGGKVRGVVWYQGESDASDAAADQFPSKFANFVAAVRKDTGNAELPVYYVQIGRHITTAPGKPWNKIQEYQRQAELKIPKVGMVASVDTYLDDGIHVGTQDLMRLGRRLALLAAKDLPGSPADNTSIKRGPRPASAKMEPGKIVLKFNDVNGSLVSEGRISGFSIHDAQGNPLPRIYRASFDPKDPTAIHLFISGEMPAGATLHYGYSRDPYCNVRDTQDMALPAFGPFPIQ